jgi:predicted metal-dependent peptidase
MTTAAIDPDISRMSMRERVVHYRLMTFQWFPYLTPYVYSLVLVERPGIGTMAVDRHGRMYYDPAFVATLTLENGGYVVMHEAWHLVLRHCHRSKDIIGESPTARQRGRLNTAYDCVVWELMEPIAHHAPVIKGGSIVTFPLLQAKYPKLKRNMLPSMIYSIMLEQDEEEERQAEQKREQERKEREEQAKQQPQQDEDDETDDEDAEDEEQDEDPEFDLSDDEDEYDPADDESEACDEGDGKDGDDDGDADEDGDDEGDDEEPTDKGDDDGPDGPDGPPKTKKKKVKQEVDADASDEGDSDQDGDDTTEEGGDSSGEAEGGEDDRPRDKWEDMTPVGDGSCSDGQPRDYEEEPNDNWDSFIEDELLDRVEKEIENCDRQHVHGIGHVPGCLKESISSKLRPQPNPWDKLRAACGLAAANPRGRPDFTFQRPNRRQAAMPSGLILKGQRKYSPKAVVILDSSGSMTTQCKVKCLAVVAQGLKAVGDFRVIVGDTMVRLDERFTSMPSNFEFKGGGGTCMVALIKYAEEKYHPDLIVLGTDTGTDWPSKPTKAQLIVAATQDGYVPSWATRVRIPDEGNVG